MSTDKIKVSSASQRALRALASTILWYEKNPGRYSWQLGAHEGFEKPDDDPLVKYCPLAILAWKMKLSTLEAAAAKLLKQPYVGAKSTEASRKFVALMDYFAHPMQPRWRHAEESMLTNLKALFTRLQVDGTAAVLANIERRTDTALRA